MQTYRYCEHYRHNRGLIGCWTPLQPQPPKPHKNGYLHSLTTNSCPIILCLVCWYKWWVTTYRKPDSIWFNTSLFEALLPFKILWFCLHNHTKLVSEVRTSFTYINTCWNHHSSNTGLFEIQYEIQLMLGHMKIVLFFEIVINLYRLWYKTLVNRYNLSRELISTWSRGRSVWWKDICNIDL